MASTAPAHPLDILINKAHFEPQVAHAIVEATEVQIQRFQFVTVPVLDARLSELEGKLGRRIDALEGRMGVLEARMEACLERKGTELVRWVFLVSLGQGSALLGAMYFLVSQLTR